jgi:DNA-binding beta-propeller fold protein YncE
MSVSPTGPLAIALALNGSGAAPNGAWFANPSTIVDVLSTAGDTVRKVGMAKAGGLAEGVSFSPDGKYLYVANFMDSNLQVYKVDGEQVVDTGTVLKLPGHPASMRGSTP